MLVSSAFNVAAGPPRRNHPAENILGDLHESFRAGRGERQRGTHLVVAIHTTVARQITQNRRPKTEQIMDGVRVLGPVQSPEFAAPLLLLHAGQCARQLAARPICHRISLRNGERFLAVRRHRARLDLLHHAEPQLRIGAQLLKRSRPSQIQLGLLLLDAVTLRAMRRQHRHHLVLEGNHGIVCRNDRGNGRQQEDNCNQSKTTAHRDRLQTTSTNLPLERHHLRRAMNRCRYAECARRKKAIRLELRGGKRQLPIHATSSHQSGFVRRAGNRFARDKHSRR